MGQLFPGDIFYSTALPAENAAFASSSVILLAPPAMDGWRVWIGSFCQLHTGQISYSSTDALPQHGHLFSIELILSIHLLIFRFQVGSGPSLRFRSPGGLILISPIWVLMDFSLLQQKLIPRGSLRTGSIQFPGNFIRRLFAKISGSHNLFLRQPDNIPHGFTTKAKHTLLCACC